MEMRLITTDYGRALFSQRVSEARAQFGSGYRGVRRGAVDNEARLAAATLIGLFANSEDGAEGMVAGMAVHDLEIYPQSCPEPDLSHFPQRFVFECGDHWALSRGAGMQVWRAAAIYVARRRPAAVLAYLAVNPPAHAGFYSAMGFVPIGRVQPYPYLETADGNPWVQPMVLQGEPLQKLVASASRLPANDVSGARVTRFNTSQRLRPMADIEAESPAETGFSPRWNRDNRFVDGASAIA